MKKLKAETEDVIANVLRAFEERSGLSVTNVHHIANYDMRLAGKTASVRLEVELP